MRKNKGFTLIELLAVIVILAIIAVITVPKVAEMIDSSRKGSAEDAFYGAIKAAELGWAKALQDNTSLEEATCTFTYDDTEKKTNYSCTNGVTMSVSGTPPKSGVIELSKTGAAEVKDASPLVFNGYNCTGNSSKATCVKPTA